MQHTQNAEQANTTKENLKETIKLKSLWIIASIGNQGGFFFGNFDQTWLYVVVQD